MRTSHSRSAPLRGIPTGLARLLLVWATSLACGRGLAAGPPAKPMLHLTNGGFVRGRLADNKWPGVIRWQGDGFVQPLEFPWAVVSSVHFQSTWEAPQAQAPYAFELDGGDLLLGNLVSLGDQSAELDVPPFGRLVLRREYLHRIDRNRPESGLIYLGPQGILGWEDATKPPLWREEGGYLAADRPGATIRGNFGLPARAVLEFQIGWWHRPDFIIALGVSDDPASVQRAFRFEVWDGALVVHRETETEADVAAVQEIAPGAGRAHFLAYLDQEQGRIVVASPSGKTLADMKLAARDRPPLPGITLINNQGDLRLDRLRIGRWTDPPRAEERRESSVRLAGGRVEGVRRLEFDGASREFILHGPEGDRRVGENEVESVRLSFPDDIDPRQLRIATPEGNLVSGQLHKVEQDRLWLSVPGFNQPVGAAVERLRSLVVQARKSTPLPDDSQMKLLEMDGVRLFGQIAEGRAGEGFSALAWKPTGCDESSALRPDASGRIVTNWWETAASGSAGASPGSPAALRNPGRTTTKRAAAGITPSNRAAAGRSAATRNPARAPSGRVLYLRAGDVVPSSVTRIDSKGVWISSSLSEKTMVPHEQVKAVELAPLRAGAPSLSEAKLERLLTLPRLQKGNPPTHLIGSVNGDYLRGRLVSMDPKTLKVEVRLEVQTIPRDRVARIVWLHPEALASAADAAEPAPKPSALQVQAVCRNGIRLTFEPERVEKGVLSGKSDVLGACQVNVKDIDQVHFGSSILAPGTTVGLQSWTLQNAREPIEEPAGDDAGSEGRDPGTGSPLVGKQAPDFELDLLKKGDRFHLASSKGKVVVLDFWASWCGPCMQAMPQVERVVDEFQGQDVRLVAVNLQESPEKISDCLARQKLGVTVALDREGAVAQQYQARAIPQTVIIDREGKVARLFVGGGPRLGDQLRNALKDVLEGPSEPKPVR